MKHSLHHTCHYPTRMCMVMNHTYNTARNYTNRGFVCTSGPFGVCWMLEPRSTLLYRRWAMEYGYIYHAASKMCVQEHTTYELRTYTSATYGR